MAARDLQVHRSGIVAGRRHSSESNYSPASISREAEEDGAAAFNVLASAVKRRWWLFALFGVISGLVGYFASQQLGKTTAFVNASLLYTGLPGAESYHPLPTSTCAELLTSVSVLNELRESRALDIPHPILASRIEAKHGLRSSLLTISLEWDDVSEGNETLNALIDIFVEQIAKQRRTTLHDHLQDIEQAQLQARTEVDEASQQIDLHREQQQKLIDEGGLSSERYRSALASISSTELAIDEKKVSQLGVEQQCASLDARAGLLREQQSKQLAALKQDVAEALAEIFSQRIETYVKDSAAYQELQAVRDALTQYSNSPEAPADFADWVATLSAKIANHNGRLTPEDLAAISQAQAEATNSASKTIDQLAAEIDSLEKNKQGLELSLIPVKNQIALLDKRLAEYRQEADKIGAEISGVGASAADALEQRLESAMDKLRVLDLQADTMRRLEKSRIREWTVSTPATAQTATLNTNNKKVFVLAFGLCGVVLASPVLISEWSRQRVSPQVRFAKSLRLPVLNERALQDFLPSRRGLAGVFPTDDQMEAVRMVSLKIQQSAHQPGAMILFSSIAAGTSAAPLIAAIAECLAQREERVLVVDAVSPEKTYLSLMNLLSEPLTATGRTAVKRNDTEDDLGVSPGLAEYLSEECEAVSDLVRPSGCPGVDIITSGHTPFPREAMASTCLTQLVESCRQNYTMILVNGPATTDIADLQMLTARADGVVLAGSSAGAKCAKVRVAVHDLIDLGAPIIGVVI